MLVDPNTVDLLTHAFPARLAFSSEDWVIICLPQLDVRPSVTSQVVAPHSRIPISITNISSKTLPWSLRLEDTTVFTIRVQWLGDFASPIVSAVSAAASAAAPESSVPVAIPHSSAIFLAEHVLSLPLIDAILVDSPIPLQEEDFILSVCMHINFQPLKASITGYQLGLITEILDDFSGQVNIIDELVNIDRAKPQPLQPPPPFIRNFAFWAQCTIPRIELKVMHGIQSSESFSSPLRVNVELEDVSASIDFHQSILRMKANLGNISATYDVAADNEVLESSVYASCLDGTCSMEKIRWTPGLCDGLLLSTTGTVLLPMDNRVLGSWMTIETVLHFENEFAEPQTPTSSDELIMRVKPFDIGKLII